MLLRGSNCLLARAIDDRIMCCAIIVSQLPLPRLQSAPEHVFILQQHYIKYQTFTFTFTLSLFLAVDSRCTLQLCCQIWLTLSLQLDLAGCWNCQRWGRKTVHRYITLATTTHQSQSSVAKQLNNYIVGHKKRANFFWTITPMFLGGFLHFLYQWKHEWILYRGVTKFTPLP